MKPINLPCEIWTMIIHHLGDTMYTRAMINLLRALGYPEAKYYYYLYQALEYSRIEWQGCKNYTDKMVLLFEKSGIDDGLDKEYLINNLTKKNRMFRTIWSLSVIDRCCINACSYFRHPQLLPYTHRLIKDTRASPIYTLEDKVKEGQLQVVLKRIKNTLRLFQKRNVIPGITYEIDF